MAELLEQTVTETSTDTDLVAAVRQVLQASPEPRTLAKIKAALPAALRSLSLESLADSLRRQVAANILFQFPKYRSGHDRFWDRPMNVHLAHLLKKAVQDSPLPWAAIRRKLPGYAQTLAESVLEEQVAKGNLFRHPPLGKRGGPRFSPQQPCPKEFLRAGLTKLFARLEQLDFSQPQLREAALDLLHEEEWSTSGTPNQAVPAAAPGTQTCSAADSATCVPTGSSEDISPSPAGNG